MNAKPLTQRQINAQQRAASKARMEVAYVEARLIVATGKCPRCGSPLKRNLSITGWWQCGQLGEPSFRTNPKGPECTWECMTGQ